MSAANSLTGWRERERGEREREREREREAHSWVCLIHLVPQGSTSQIILLQRACYSTKEFVEEFSLISPV